MVCRKQNLGESKKNLEWKKALGLSTCEAGRSVLLSAVIRKRDHGATVPGGTRAVSETSIRKRQKGRLIFCITDQK